MKSETSRRSFLSRAGKGLGLAALSVPSIGDLVKEVEAASRSVTHLTPQQAAIDEDYWCVISGSRKTPLPIRCGKSSNHSRKQFVRVWPKCLVVTVKRLQLLETLQS